MMNKQCPGGMRDAYRGDRRRRDQIRDRLMFLAQGPRMSLRPPLSLGAVRGPGSSTSRGAPTTLG